ncbi:MAG: sigma-70 factor domain-containing protein, partial [Cyanobacteria bacterium J06631_9]
MAQSTSRDSASIKDAKKPQAKTSAKKVTPMKTTNQTATATKKKTAKKTAAKKAATKKTSAKATATKKTTKKAAKKKSTRKAKPLYTTDAVRAYLHEIGRVPLLSHEDEIILGKQVQQMMALLAIKDELIEQLPVNDAEEASKAEDQLEAPLE